MPSVWPAFASEAEAVREGHIGRQRRQRRQPIKKPGVGKCFFITGEQNDGYSASATCGMRNRNEAT
jgi:hypothetical protein